MVEKLTLFEVRLDGSRFGMDDRVEAHAAPEEYVEVRESGGNRRRLLAVGLVAGAVAAAALRRRGRDAENIEIDEVDAEPVEIEQ